MSDRTAFLIDEWRAGVAGRRVLARQVIAEAVLPGAFVEPVLRRLKREIVYDRMSSADQQLFRTMASQLRRIVGNWYRLDQAVKSSFLSGKVPYSSVCKTIAEMGD